jgi:predicted dehydrogenase
MAMGQLGKTGVDEHDAILLEHGNGALANLYVSLRGKSSPDLTLIGDKGKIYAHAPIFCPGKLTITVDGKEEVIELPFEANGYQFEVMEVGRCLRAGKTESGIMPLDETLQIMRTMDNIRSQFGLTYSNE